MVGKEFKVNKYITLNLEDAQTIIYVNGKSFKQCKFLLLDIPVDKIKSLDEIESIDEATEKLDCSMEGDNQSKYRIPPETEFWGHCSNLQVWAENKYNTRLLHRNLAFPLLKKLTEVGDPLAKKVFKEEIAKRFFSGHIPVLHFLVDDNYLKFLNHEEKNSLMKEFLIEEKHRINEKPIQEVFQKIALNEILDQFPNNGEIFYQLDQKDKKYNIVKLEIKRATKNPIKNFEMVREIKYLSNLQSLKLFNFEIPEINNLVRLSFLQHLDLQFNRISEIKGLKTLKNLITLDLSQNQINQIKGLENNIKLEELDLFGNLLSEIENIDHLKNLKKLNLADNALKLIKGLNNLIEITELRLDGNLITNIEGLKELTNLEILNLQGNQISEVEGLENLINLKKLNLSYNKIKKIKGLDNLKNLQYLDLSFNQISELKGLENLFNIKSIKLNGNSSLEKILKQFKFSREYVQFCRNSKKKF